MAALSAGLLLHLSVFAAGAPAGAQSYEQAQKQATVSGQPLLVLVGADWCPGCVTMKNSVLPQMAGRGGLKKVSYANVDADQEPELASHLMRGNGIPQLIIFSKRADGEWHREQITGTASEAQVLALIERARAAQLAGKTANPSASEAVAGE
jgi:thioredoxin-like negative regulator of GroEL